MSDKIEKVQRTAIYVILGALAHRDYYCNLAILDLPSLEERREKIVKKFATQIMKNPFHKNIFEQNNSHNTRSGNRVIVPKAKTARYDNSSVPSLAKLINNM